MVKLRKGLFLLTQSTHKQAIVSLEHTHNPESTTAIPARFTRLYTTMLIAMAVLLTVAQGLTQWRLRTLQDELWIIRYTALQRHQGQQIVKQVLQLTDGKDLPDFNRNTKELRQVFGKFERYHLEGRTGRVTDHAVSIPNSDTVQRLYAGIQAEFSAYQHSVRRLMTLRTPADVARPNVQEAVALLLANEKPFLEKIDGIVREHTAELRAKLKRLQDIELSLYGFTMLVLAGIGLFILRPAARRLRQTFAQLVEARNQTSAVNHELLGANKSLTETRQKLAEATRLQYQQQIDEQQIRTSALIAGQEEERKRLSRDLHDGLGQMLTAIKLQLEGLETSLNRTQPAGQPNEPGYAKNLHTLKTLVKQTIQETRTIANNLMPSVLSDFGIVPALKMVAETDRTEAVDVTFSTNVAASLNRLNRNTEIMLYRVTQEAVSNAIRHGNPSHIHIELIEQKSVLYLTITDDGCGFNLPKKDESGGEISAVESENGVLTRPRPKQRTPSQGIHNMRQRVRLLNGSFRLHSVPGKGTTVHVSIPKKVTMQL